MDVLLALLGGVVSGVIGGWISRGRYDLRIGDGNTVASGAVGASRDANIVGGDQQLHNPVVVNVGSTHSPDSPQLPTPIGRPHLVVTKPTNEDGLTLTNSGDEAAHGVRWIAIDRLGDERFSSNEACDLQPGTTTSLIRSVRNVADICIFYRLSADADHEERFQWHVGAE